MDDLVQWLRAQYAEDERIARAAAAAQGPVWWYKANLGGMDGRVLAGRVLDDGREVALAEALTARSAAAGEHAAVHDPARVLRDIDAKRRIIDECAYWHIKLAQEAADPPPVPYPALGQILDAATPILRVLALPYVDRPGYREEWRPE